MSMFERERTSTEVVMYALYLYFLGRSFRKTSDAIEPFEERSYVAVWDWAQRFNPKQVYPCKRIAAFLIDETPVQIGPSDAWLWVCVEPVHRVVLGVYISRHRNMLVAESFLRSLVHLYGKHVVYSDGGSWYPDACRSLNLEHRLHSPYEKSIVGRVTQYFKDRVEGFDDYYPCRKGLDCDLSHVYNWLAVFVFLHNGIIRSHIKFRLLVRLMSGGEA